MAIQIHQRQIVPISPAIPNLASYGFDSLYLVPTFEGKTGRSKYREFNNGQQAPAFKPADPIKRWYITSDTALSLGYWDMAQAKPTFVSKTYSPEELAAINLPGDYEYPMPQAPAASGAFWIANAENSGGTVTQQQKVYIPAQGLSLYSEALALSRELQAAGYEISGVQETLLQGIYGVHYDTTEPRRLWNISFAGNLQNAAMILALKNKNGIGAPGRWSTPKDAPSPIWFSLVGVQTEFNVQPEVPIPSRNLVDGEMLAAAFGGTWRIYPNSGTAQQYSATNGDIMTAIGGIQRLIASGASSVNTDAIAGMQRQLATLTATLIALRKSLADGLRNIGINID